MTDSYQCKTCKKLKPLTAEFFHFAHNKTGFLHECKNCVSCKRKAKYSPKISKKKCTVCRKNKTLSKEYNTDPRTKDGYKSECKICHSEQQATGRRDRQLKAIREAELSLQTLADQTYQKERLSKFLEQLPLVITNLTKTLDILLDRVHSLESKMRPMDVHSPRAIGDYQEESE